MIPPRHVRSPFDASAYQNQVAPLFEKFTTLRFVVVTSMVRGEAPRAHSWVYCRGPDPEFLVEDYSEALDEWARYQDDSYRTSLH